MSSRLVRALAGEAALARRGERLGTVETSLPGIYNFENLIGVMRKAAALRDARCALVVDFASRLARAPDHLDAAEHRFFVAAERSSLAANPIVPKGVQPGTPEGKALFNPILWLVNRPQDLPSSRWIPRG